MDRGRRSAPRLPNLGTRDLLAGILEGEEGHADWLESQLELIRQVGDSQYLAQQIRE